MSAASIASEPFENSLLLSISHAFRDVIDATIFRDSSAIQESLYEDWRISFLSELLMVLKALQHEKLLDRRVFSLEEWLNIRFLTISGKLPHLQLLKQFLNK